MMLGKLPVSGRLANLDALAVDAGGGYWTFFLS